MMLLAPRLAARLSKAVEQRKPKLPEKSKANHALLLEKERVNRLYLEFQATPNDSISIIKQRFIRKKKLLANRRLYMPNVPLQPHRNGSTCCSSTAS